jgi:hypothetical protein
MASEVKTGEVRRHRFFVDFPSRFIRALAFAPLSRAKLSGDG